MPCLSDHMNPKTDEKESKVVCQHIVILSEKLNRAVPDWVQKGAAEYYGVESRIDEATALLCALCRETLDSIIYSCSSVSERALAFWWDEHKEHDTKRLEREEIEKIEQEFLKKRAMQDIELRLRELLCDHPKILINQILNQIENH